MEITATMKRVAWGISLVAGLAALSGCATYTTPAAGVNLSSLTDADIAELMRLEPASEFPARIAVARAQAPGYSSRTSRGYGDGRYSVVTVRDIEDEADFERLSRLEMVAGVAPLSRLLLPQNMESIKDLRVAAASLKTDLLLIYSVDTAFHVEGTPLGPLSAITLGFLPNKKAFVTSTTSGILVDVRTGYVYGAAEATETEEQRTTIWGTQDAIDAARIVAEKGSFKAFVTEFETLWNSVVAGHAGRQQ